MIMCACCRWPKPADYIKISDLHREWEEGIEYDRRDKQTVPWKQLERDLAQNKQSQPWRIGERKMIHERKILIYSLLKAEQHGQKLDQFMPHLQRLAEAQMRDGKGKGKGRAPCLFTHVRRIFEADFPAYFIPKPTVYEREELKW